jgi:blue copper oxidase
MKNALLITALLLYSGALFSQNPLFIPDTLSGNSISLQLQHGTKQFYPGTPTQTMGINGSFLAPTLILNRGQQVTLNVQNQLTDTTTIHWHGLHVSPANDGGPHIFVTPGQTWSPSFTVLDWASTYWYHPHLHYKTVEHVAAGIAGMIIVRDSIEAALALPRQYGIDDIPVIIQTRQFSTSNQIVVRQHLDTAVMINGTLKPFIQLPAQRIRLRLLNGSIERVYNIGLSTNESFQQIGSDGGLLAAPVTMSRLQLAPGERAEIIVNLTGKQNQTIQLMSYAAQLPNAIYGAAQPGMGFGQQLPGYSNNALNGSNFNLLEMQVGAPGDLPAGPTPSTLVSHSIFAPSQADTTRILTFMSAAMGPTAIQGPFMINNAHFDMNVINQHIPFNNIEIWELQNQTPIGHPFHLHDVPFYILSVNGAQPIASLRGRKDVVFVPAMGNVRFITQFETFFDDSLPYMYHCHMLTHEDDGMMGQFLVNSPFASSVKQYALQKASVHLYPNPANSEVYIKSTANLNKPLNLEIKDLQGRLLKTLVLYDERARVDISELLPGIYLFVATDGESSFSARLIKQ